MYNENFIGLSYIGDIISLYPALAIASSPPVIISLRDNLMGIVAPNKMPKVNHFEFINSSQNSGDITKWTLLFLSIIIIPIFLLTAILKDQI
jgi:hypothetical protein